LGGNRYVSLGIQSSFLLIDRLTSLGNVGSQEGLKATGFNPMARLCYFYPKGREVPSRQELDLKTHGKLGVDFIKDPLYRAGILDQGVDRTRQKILHTEKLTGDAG
jgi:hypothetical protein